MIYSRYPGGGQMMMSGGGGAPGMGMRMPMAMRTQMPPGRVIPGPGEEEEREGGSREERTDRLIH